MRGKFVAALAVALALLGALAPDALAQRRDRDREWVLLGEKEVGFRVDRESIRIGQSEDWYRGNVFRRLHLVAERNDVYLLSVRLVYFNDYAEDIRVEQMIREGDYYPIDLRGERSFIRRVDMVYRARPDFGGRAIVKLYGELGRGGGRPGYTGGGGGREQWEQLDCKDVALFTKDRDTIRVGRREGRFKAIRLHVRGADVEIFNVRVYYADGQPDDLEVKHFFREGDYSRPLQLPGWGRAIDRIELRYRTVPNFKGLAKVCVEGLQ